MGNRRCNRRGSVFSYNRTSGFLRVAMLVSVVCLASIGRVPPSDKSTTRGQLVESRIVKKYKDGLVS